MDHNKKFHLPDEKYNDTRFTYADFEAFLVIYYNFFLPLKEMGIFYSPILSDARHALDAICQRCCGRSIERAVEAPFVNSLSVEFRVPNKLTFYAAMAALNNFETWFKLDPDKQQEECYQVVQLAKQFKWLVEYFDLGEGVHINWPSEGGSVLSCKKFNGPEVYIHLEDILEVKKGKGACESLPKDIAPLYLEAERMFGFGVAWCIFFTAFPAEFAHHLSLRQWQEVFKAAPQGSEMSRVAWANIELMLKDQKSSK